VSNDTTTFFPIYIMVFIASLVTIFVGWKLSTIISNPAVYLQPAVDTAAREIAMVCDGKFESKTLSPPPPGASYLVMSCLDRSIAVGTSGVMAMWELYQAYKGISDLKKSVKEGLDGLKKGANKVDDVFAIAYKDGKLIIDPDDFDDIRDAIDGCRDALAKSDELADGLGKVMKTADQPSDVVDLKGEIKDISKNFDEMDNAIKGAGNGPLEIDCTANEGLCAAFLGASDRLKDLYSSLNAAQKAAEAAVGFAGDVGRIKRVLGLGVQNSKGYKKLTELKDLHDTVLGTTKRLARTRRIASSISGARAATRQARWHWVMQPLILGNTDRWAARRIINMMGGFGGGIVLDYLESNDGFYSIIEGAFVGVQYTPQIINLVDVMDLDEAKTDEVLDIYRYSFNVSGEYIGVGDRLKEEIPREMRGKGYPETAAYVYGSPAEKLLTIGGMLNIDPSIFAYATTEYVTFVDDWCEEDSCFEYLAEVMEVGLNVSTGDNTISDLRTVVNSYSQEDMEKEKEDFNYILNYLEGVNDEVAYVTDASFDVQQRVASWMKDNCETRVLEFPDWNVEVASCGMVVDCTPESFCYVGLPVVSADPWIPYLPVTYLDGTDVPAMAKIAGFNYDSAAKVVTPGGFTGCGGISGEPEWNKAYICAVLPTSYRCKVVGCGKYVAVEFVPFNPNTWAEDRGDSVWIRGNLLKW
jgi:hypothetical protein